MFPAIDSIQRSKPVPPPSFSFEAPPDDEGDDDQIHLPPLVSLDLAPPRVPSLSVGSTPHANTSSLAAPTSTVKLAKKVRVRIEPGYSQLDWAKLKSSGADLRVRAFSLPGARVIRD